MNGRVAYLQISHLKGPDLFFCLHSPHLNKATHVSRCHKLGVVAEGGTRHWVFMSWWHWESKVSNDSNDTTWGSVCQSFLNYTAPPVWSLGMKYFINIYCHTHTQIVQTYLHIQRGPLHHSQSTHRPCHPLRLWQLNYLFEGPDWRRTRSLTENVNHNALLGKTRQAHVYWQQWHSYGFFQSSQN